MNASSSFIVRLLAFVIAAALPAGLAHAHEYFLEPGKYTVAVGEEFSVEHKNGQNFSGSTFPWIGSWNARSEVWQNGKGKDYVGNDGDLPAIVLKGDTGGLMTIIHEGYPSSYTFKTWEKFNSYLEKEGLTARLPDHLAAGYPKEKIGEVYTRFAKALVNVGKVSGTDADTGLKIELIAKRNPGLLKRGDALPVELLYLGKPLAGATIKVFAGVGNEVARKVITDAKGRAKIPDIGSGPYLLNAIHMFKPVSTSPEAEDAHWETYWASMTFARP